jgi:hypothetical protein
VPSAVGTAEVRTQTRMSREPSSPL